MSESFEQIKDEEKQQMGTVSGTAGAKVPALRSNGAWIPGLVLIGIGVIFLLSNLTDFELDNWWALFILIPAFGAFGNAYRVYQSQGRLGREGRGSFIGGLVFVFVASIFLLELDWGQVWPVFLILAGLGVLLGGFWD
jgi:hypothetical protein